MNRTNTKSGHKHHYSSPHPLNHIDLKPFQIIEYISGEGSKRLALVTAHTTSELKNNRHVSDTSDNNEYNYNV